MQNLLNINGAVFCRLGGLPPHMPLKSFQACTLALKMWSFAHKHHRFPLLWSLYSKAAPKNTSKENSLAYYFYNVLLLCSINPHLGN